MLINEKRLSKSTLNKYLFEELFYGQQKDVYIHNLYGFNNDIRYKDKLDDIISEKYDRDSNFNYIATSLLSNEDERLELVACKSILNLQTNEISKIKMIFAYLIKKFDAKGNLIDEHSYIPIEIDLIKKIAICKVYPKTSLYKEEYKPEYLYNKYMDIVTEMFTLQFNSFNTKHKVALYNMSEELYQQIYNKMISSKSVELSKLIENFAQEAKGKINVKNIESKAKDNNVFDIISSITRYFDQLLITDILNSKDIDNEDMAGIDGIVTYLRFSDGTNVSAKVKGENYRASIYTSETYMALRDPIENSNKISEIKVIWIEDDRNLRVRYNTNSCEYLYMHFYKDFGVKDFEYGYRKYKEYESMVISKTAEMAR
ncbi:hypothetical protein [Clostridium swellfunianum]|uniref:hypothetical protein n=1 Tax=Clostridium swellfunianum TaxID=1367462 RepID=UPI00202FE4A5|nr:hypothetical protein [Clostridium swellfunianum]